MSEPRPAQRVVKRSLQIAGHRTSISLEEIFWTELRAIASARAQSIAGLVAEVDAGRGETNLSSALRVFVLETVRGARVLVREAAFHARVTDVRRPVARGIDRHHAIAAHVHFE